MKTFFCLLFSFICIPSLAQEAFNFQTYSDMKNLSAVSSTNEGIWASSSGGAFFYDNSQKTFQTLTRSKGLNGIVLTALSIDSEGKIWLGSSNGIIDVYNPDDNSIESIFDISNSDRTFKKINSLVSYGDTIIASTDFCISLIDSKNLVFLDTYFKFGNMPSNIKVNSASKYGVLFACTDLGIAIQKKGATNLSAPESWNVYTTGNGLPSNVINKAISFSGTIIAATEKGLSFFNGTSWQQYLSQFDNQNILDILVQDNALYILTARSIYLYSNQNVEQIYTASFDLKKLFYSETAGLIAASNNGVLIVNTKETVSPNGPFANQFTGLSVDKNGNLWAASGTDVSGKGFYKYNNSTWTNFNKSNTPILPTNSYHVVYASPDNTIYFGNWGYGFLRIKNENLDVFGVENSGMQGFEGNPNFLVVTAFGNDSKNNLWVLNYGAADRRPISLMTTDSTWHHFSIPAMSGLYVQQNYGLVVDQYDIKWFYSIDNTRPGLYYFNENKTFDDPTDDFSGYLNKSSGLNDNIVTSILVDKRGDLWVGTSAGVNIISNSQTILLGDPGLRITSVFTLRQQSINCMAVDPLNRKWIGTNQGLLLVNSDGTTLLDALDSKNSPLLSDIIRSIAVDDISGRVYVGTDEGLTSFETTALMPKESFTKLFIYPNPFIINGKNNSITIDGLIRDSEIKVLTITGRLVKEFSSPGGRVAEWNGKDMNGDFVNSGVYLIIAFDHEGNNTITGKVAVLRE